jgi:hypothetical protein
MRYREIQKKLKRLGCIVSMILGLALVGLSQNRYCMTVRDMVGGVIPKAVIKFSPKKKLASRTKYKLVTDDKGSVDKILMDGIYDIIVKADGFKKTVLKNQQVPYDPQSCVTVTLRSAVPPHQITMIK